MPDLIGIVGNLNTKASSPHCF